MTIPAAPSGLTATVAGSDTINLAWTDNASNETGFKIEESEDGGGSWTEISTVIADSTALIRTGLAAGHRYHYRVRAYNGDGNSAYSNVASAITDGGPQIAYDIGIELFVDWDLDGTYTDESAYLVSARGTHRLASPSQSITATAGRVAECTVVVDNGSGRFSSLNADGPLYDDIGAGKLYHIPVKVQISAVEAGDTPLYIAVFTGVARIPNESTLTRREPKTLSFDCRGIEEALLNRRQRTTRANFASYHDNGVTESEFMAAVISDSGADIATELDDGMANMPWSWLDNESIIEELWKLAAACGGRFYGDAYGQLAYENAAHWLKSPHTFSQQTYRRGNGFTRLILKWDETELAEEMIVSWAERTLGAPEEIFNSEFFTVAPGETKTQWAELSVPLYAVSGLSFKATTPGGIDLSGDVTVTPTYYAQAVKFEVANAGSITANVRITLTGRSLSESETQTLQATSADSFWTSREGRSRKVPTTKWLQTQGQATLLKGLLVDRQQTPSLVAALEGCPGNPLRWLGDRITIEDDEVYLDETDFYITAISWRYGSRGFTQDIEAIRCSDVFLYADDPGYFILNTDTLASSKKVFY